MKSQTTLSFEKYFDPESEDFVICYYCDHLAGHHRDDSCHICEVCYERHEYFDSVGNEQVLACSKCFEEWSFIDDPEEVIPSLNLPLDSEADSDEIEELFKDNYAIKCPKCQTVNSVTIHKQCSCDGPIYPDN